MSPAQSPGRFPPMPVIETHELTKRYGLRRAKSVLAVDKVSFAGGRAPAN